MNRPFNTRALSVWDYHQADLSEFLTPFTPDQEQLAESLLFLRKKYASLLPVSTVQEGDIVTLRCQSEKPRFRKESITVNVGKNLYSRELEAQLPGMTVGQTREIQVGDTPVTVELLKAERNTPAELTEEFLCRTFVDVHTMEALENWYIREQFEHHVKQLANEAAGYLQQQAVANSRIIVDEEERKSARAAAEKSVREMWQLNGLPLEQMTDEQAQEVLGYPSAQAYIDWFADLCELDLPCAALGYALLQAEDREPTETAYRETCRKMKEEEGATAEQLEEYTFAVYARQLCSEHYHEVLENYAYHVIKEKLS